MAMYSNELQPRVAKLALRSDSLTRGKNSVPVADAVATVDASGHEWAVALVNRHPDRPLSCTVRMKERPLDGAFSAVVLESDSPEAYNNIAAPDRVAPKTKTLAIKAGLIELPPHSLTILKARL